MALFKGMPFQLPFTLFCTSDLHLERADVRSHPTPLSFVQRLVDTMPSTEVCVLAGDLGDPTLCEFGAFLSACVAKYKCVLFVTGNHERWTLPSASIRTLVNELGAVYLENEFYLYKGVWFYGATLWTELKNRSRELCETIHDFKAIANFSPDQWQKEHTTSRASLLRFLSQNVGETTVVITHHPPSNRCIPSQFMPDPTNQFYATNLEFVLNGPHAPVAWICGHTHSPLCETIGQTLVVNNPHRCIDNTWYGWADPQAYWHCD